MTVLFITGHPAQIHNFRIVKQLLESHGHRVVWVSSKKDISFELLKIYGIEAYEIIRPAKKFSAKVKALFVNSKRIVDVIRKEKVDIVVSRVSPFGTLAALLTRKPHIALADTESSGIYDTIFSKLINVLITSQSFGRQLRNDQIRIQSNIELFYLHPNHFKPSDRIFQFLNIEKGTPFVIMRFVSWEAYHDKGLHGYSQENIIKAVQSVSPFAKVFISAEGSLPQELEDKRIKIPYELMHEALFHASLFFGEGASMAAEASVLGTPAIFLNDNWSGNALDLMKYQLFFAFKSDENDQLKSIEKAVQLLSNPHLKQEMNQLKEQYLQNKIDASTFLADFIENYPESKRKLNTH